MKLINGNGQLGSKLQTQIGLHVDLADVSIYHTWNVSDKSKDIQYREYCKFAEFVDNTDNKIVFISTKSENQTWYTYYKQKAEGYLLLNHDKCIILRFPTFIGTPCRLFEPNAEPFGEVELISINDVVEKILHYASKIENTKNRIWDIKGEKVSAKLVTDILKIK